MSRIVKPAKSIVQMNAKLATLVFNLINLILVIRHAVFLIVKLAKAKIKTSAKYATLAIKLINRILVI